MFDPGCQAFSGAPAWRSQVSRAASAASRDCQKRNCGVPGAAVPAGGIGPGCAALKLTPATLAAGAACSAIALMAGAPTPASGSLGMKLIGIRELLSAH